MNHDGLKDCSLRLLCLYMTVQNHWELVEGLSASGLDFERRSSLLSSAALPVSSAWKKNE